MGAARTGSTDRRMTSVLDSHGLFKEASERDDAGLKARAQLRLRIPAGLHEVQIGRQAGEGASWQLRLWGDGRPTMPLCNGYHDLQPIQQSHVTAQISTAS